MRARVRAAPWLSGRDVARVVPTTISTSGGGAAANPDRASRSAGPWTISTDFFGVPRSVFPERWRKISESSVTVSRAPSRNCISADDFWCVRTPSRSTSTSPTWASCQGMGEGRSST